VKTFPLVTLPENRRRRLQRAWKSQRANQAWQEFWRCRDQEAVENSTMRVYTAMVISGVNVQLEKIGCGYINLDTGTWHTDATLQSSDRRSMRLHKIVSRLGWGNWK
jgi:hypothetical protein